MKYAALVSYLGTRYLGFEKQAGHETIQGHLERALSFMASRPIKIHCAGRTDKGVHATGQVISFDYDPIKDIPLFISVMNRLLPSDIAIKDVASVPDDFDARHSAKGKHYVYAFCDGGKDPFRPYEYQFSYPSFDARLFEEALSLYEGKHDFRNFTTKKEDIEDFVRILRKPTLESLGEGHYEATFIGNGFMTYMVRILVGAAFRVAFGRMDLESLIAALNPSGERHILSMKAEPCGLSLVEVYYEDDPFKKEKHEQH